MTSVRMGWGGRYLLSRLAVWPVCTTQKWQQVQALSILRTNVLVQGGPKLEAVQFRCMLAQLGS